MNGVIATFRSVFRTQFQDSRISRVWDYIDVLVQERRNSSALAMELRLSCTNPSIYGYERG